MYIVYKQSECTDLDIVAADVDVVCSEVKVGRGDGANPDKSQSF